MNRGWKPVVNRLGFSSYSELYYRAKSDNTGEITPQIVEAITTNETSFFRDQSPFDLLKFKIIPEHFERVENPERKENKTLRIWSAACSSGQEIYSVTMILKELLGQLELYNVKMVATDISDGMVSKASKGIYTPMEVNRGLSPGQIGKYFYAEENNYKIRDELRAFVTFRKINLLEPFTGLDYFDIILCRNVAIYFKPEDRKKLFTRFANQLNPNGILIIGSSETLLGICDCFQQREYRGTRYHILP